jgi:hypothetical protein
MDSRSTRFRLSFHGVSSSLQAIDERTEEHAKMSGPIVRKYGFPNFEKIFGEKQPAHGVEGEPTATPTSPSTSEAAKSPETNEPDKHKSGASKP